jgi:hypothetical protein
LSYFLSSLPLSISIFLLLVIPTAIAMAAQALIHRWVGVEKLVQNNEIVRVQIRNRGRDLRRPSRFAVIVV